MSEKRKERVFNTREEFLKAIGEEKMPDNFGADFLDTVIEFETRGTPYLESDYLESLERDFGAFDDKYGFVMKCAALVRENETAALYSLCAKKMIENRAPDEHPALPELTGVSERDSLAFEMAPYFATVAFAYEIVNGHRADGVPEDVIRATLRHVCREPICVSETRRGREGFLVLSHFNWNIYFISREILRVGVLNFEMRKGFTTFARVFENKNGEYRLLVNGQKLAKDGRHGECAGCVPYLTAEIEETDTEITGYGVDTHYALSTMKRITLSKSEWQEAIRPDGRVINVHIPATREFNRDTVAEAYKRVREIIKRSFPDYKDAPFVCTSWLMDPLLENYLKPDSNIIAFQSKYMRFPIKSSGTGIFSYLFGKSADTPIADLPENTSLQRRIKELYLNGGYIYGGSGIFFYKD